MMFRVLAFPTIGESIFGSHFKYFGALGFQQVGNPFLGFILSVLGHSRLTPFLDTQEAFFRNNNSPWNVLVENSRLILAVGTVTGWCATEDDSAGN